MSVFYDNYIAKCANANKSPSAVAEENGLSRTSPNGWKKGKLPRDATLKKLADYFGCSVSDLTGETPEENKKPAENGGPEDVPGEFMRLQEANELFLQLDEAGRAQALAYLKFLASQREN